MKNIILILGTIVFLFVAIVGIRIGYAKTNHINTDIFRYKGAYIGDNSAVANIAYHLSTSKEFKQVSLQTKKKPYGMTLEYDQVQNVSRNEDKKNVITTATYMFTLIRNVDWVTVDYPYGKYSLTRERLQQWYGADLSKITNEKALKQLINNHLKDDTKVNRLFEK